jgi:hypothetical protein
MPDCSRPSPDSIKINVEAPRPLNGRGSVVVQVKYRVSGYEVPFNPVSINIL